jgi:hypothetical protein
VYSHLNDAELIAVVEASSKALALELHNTKPSASALSQIIARLALVKPELDKRAAD